MDDIARALLGRGALVSARELLAVVVARGGSDAARCRDELLRLDANPDEAHAVPNLVLSAELASEMAGDGRFREAQIVARTLEPSLRAIELLASLDRILAPLPEGTSPHIASAFETARQRADRNLAQQLAQDPNASEEVRRRATAIVELRRGPSASASSDSSLERVRTGRTHPAVSDAVRSLLEHRDWARGESELRALSAHVGAGDVLTSLLQLREAMARLFEEETGQGGSTVPLQGGSVAVFHLRMGNLAEAERTLRRVVAQDPSDARATSLLNDIDHLRGVAARSQSVPPPAAPTPDWLDKRGRKPSVEGWAPSKRMPTPSPETQEVVTSVMRPDEQAELHLRAGRVDKAIELYEHLAATYPDRPHFAQRAEEIRRLQAKRDLVFVDELTIRHAPLRQPKLPVEPPEVLPEEATAQASLPVVTPRAPALALGPPPTIPAAGEAAPVVVRGIVRVS